MRVNSNNGVNDLHWHNGGTCHGSPTQAKAEEEAVSNHWIGKILEREDVLEDGTKVKCYSSIVGAFGNHGERGRYVSEIKVVAVPIA
jgi:hypothetical protein